MNAVPFLDREADSSHVDPVKVETDYMLEEITTDIKTSVYKMIVLE